MSETPRVALVTGGSRGIGRACAERLADDGFDICLTYVSRPEQAEEVVRAIEAKGRAARAFRLDSADRAAVADFFRDEIKGKMELAAVVNNAGITRDALLIRMKDEDWDKVLEVNLTGAFAVLREAAKIMAKQRSGSIVNMASVVGQMGNAGQANYVAAKAGLIGVTKTAARELAGRGVRVNAVAPGFIQTEMTAQLPEKIVEQMQAAIPMARLGGVNDIAGAVSFLAGPDSSYITGQVLAVNGGMYM
ncbi:MAG: 3-oxoacyl-[acyl-carrier-protein] reductase [Desulfovibrionaceae bacterium]